MQTAWVQGAWHELILVKWFQGFSGINLYLSTLFHHRNHAPLYHLVIEV